LIEVNLLPGGKKRAARGPGFSFKLPTIDTLPTDPWILGSAAVIVLVLVAMGYLYMSTNSQREELTLAVQAAQADSVRYFDFIERKAVLTARQDSVAQRVVIIQDIDGDRYVWPHLLDEVARALPEYTWLTQLLQVSGGEEIQFRVTGQAGNQFALARFYENLEASPFIRDVDFISSVQETVTTGAGTQRVVSGFEFEAFFDPPSPDYLEMVPLFEGAVSEEEETPAAPEEAAAPPPDTAQASSSGAPAGGPQA
jgi:Tfp pilus assembly protein PilN